MTVRDLSCRGATTPGGRRSLIGQVQSFASVGFRAAQTRQNVTMNCSLELHDSRVSSVQSTDGVVIINFEAAYLHLSDGVPGSDKGTGWVQSGSLKFASANLTGAPDIGEGWIVDGSLRVGSAGELRLIPVPLNVSGSVAARFTFNNGCIVRVQAEGARLTMTGEPAFVEAFPGA